MEKLDPVEYLLNRMEAARDVPPPTVDYPARRKDVVNHVAALREENTKLRSAIREWADARKETARFVGYGAASNVFAPVPSQRQVHADAALALLAAPEARDAE